MICLDFRSLRLQNCHIAYLPATNSAQGTHSTSGNDTVERWAIQNKWEVLPPKALKTFELEANDLWKRRLYVFISKDIIKFLISVESDLRSLRDTYIIVSCLNSIGYVYYTQPHQNPTARGTISNRSRNMSQQVIR